MLSRLRHLFASERPRHAIIAIILAVVVGATTILRPLDITVWSLQSKLFERQPSGDIVFVEVDIDEKSQTNASQNRRLLRALRSFDRADASLIVFELPIQRSKSPKIDAALRAQLLSMRDRVVLTRTVSPDSDRFGKALPSDPYFENGLALASDDYTTDFLGYVWGVRPNYDDAGVAIPSVWTRLAGRQVGAERPVYPDYTFNPHLSPQFDLPATGQLNLASLETMRGKQIIFGSSRSIRLPEYGDQPASLLHILAAETYRGGRGFLFVWPLMVAAFGLVLLAIAILAQTGRSRQRLYMILLGSIPVLIATCAFFGARAEVAGLFALTAVYGGQRLFAFYRRRYLYIEPRSKLPNFAAFRRDFAEVLPERSKAIVVAKIARMDSVFTTLSQLQQVRYLRLVANRLTLGENGATVYYDGGKYFALMLDMELYDDLEGHLRGLRAVASQAVPIGERMLDVSMTIGVDCASVADPTNRLSSAIAAADQAREAYRPVFIISDLSTEIEEWDHSLQTRLELALSENRIGINLQPQSNLQTGEIVAAEALARWVDRERGNVPPIQFIGQCERVGRLDDLTRRVLSKSLDAAEILSAQGFDQQISINVSAIQFVDDRIVSLIEEELSGRNFVPKRLTIEITETARIEDLIAARRIMERIKRGGPKFAIDDFGIESANFQALFELPFDEIKIDQLFIRNLSESEKARAIVSNLVRLAGDANMVSVAEGIESHAMFNLLRDMGCNRGQGYFIARPMPLVQFEETLRLQRNGKALGRSLG